MAQERTKLEEEDIQIGMEEHRVDEDTLGALDG